MTADQWFTDADVAAARKAFRAASGAAITRSGPDPMEAALAAVVPARVAELQAEIERLRGANHGDPTHLPPTRLAELRKHYERFDKHSPTAIELIDEIERLRSALNNAAAEIADRFGNLCQWEADERHECTCHIAAHDAALIARGEA